MLKIACLAVVLSGCVDDTPNYMRVEVKQGDKDGPGDWYDGYVSYTGPNDETVPPGVFAMRIRDEGQVLAVDGARLMIDPISKCQAKTEVSCSGGVCYADFVQPELGICVVYVTALVGDKRSDRCWFMGTYATWDEPSDEEWALVDAHQCGGTTTTASSAPP